MKVRRNGIHAGNVFLHYREYCRYSLKLLQKANQRDRLHGVWRQMPLSIIHGRSINASATPTSIDAGFLSAISM